MRRKTLLIIGGAIVVIVAAGALLFYSYVRSLMAPKPLEITYATMQTQMPQGAACAGGRDESTAIAKEILNLETDNIYVAGGANPIPDDVWASYGFRLPLLKNSTRNLLFDGSCFFRSPDAPPDCSGDACFSIDEIEGYTWLKLTTIAGNSCFPDASGCSGDVVNPGYVSINTIAKCHRMVFDGPVIYELSDGLGNLYVMHATATGTPDVTGPVLPQGWALTERTISEPLVLLPFGGGNQCYYNIVRDNLVQSYHQYVYAGDQYPPAIAD
ncbi:MAG: hypothetical protein IT320_22785 [Anaerolineae bacterium]|nr:hypothetical protein [Anaerolineae bacterium]